MCTFYFYFLFWREVANECLNQPTCGREKMNVGKRDSGRITDVEQARLLVSCRGGILCCPGHGHLFTVGNWVLKNAEGNFFHSA
jgi:hypothetical protein